MAVSKGKPSCFKKTSTVCFYNIQLHATVYTTKVERAVLQPAKLSSNAKDVSHVPLMEATVSKIWEVNSFTFVLESCSKKITLNALPK